MTLVSNNSNTINSRSMQRQCCCHHHCIRRKRRKISTTFITTLSTLLLLLLLQTNTLPNNLLVTVVNAKEIIATNEWQLLSENDTIPAGLHVRMDLSTGEKWVKIASDDDDEGENDIKAVLHDNEVNGKVETAVMDASGALSIIDNPDTNDDGTTTNNNKEQHHTTTTTKNKDYNMMHRVMSKLPPEELQKFGGLPSLPEPPPTTSKVTTAQRIEFEKQMEDIWNKRQEELRKIMTAQEGEGETDIMNVPVRVLKERINTIKYYLDNVDGCLMDILDEKQQRKEMEDNNEKSEEGYDDLNNIINALHDLEYQLSDVDMARDFHTLGGWPYLVSLLHDNVHNKRISSTTTAAATVEKMMILVDEIQALAAMAIGTAVSNLDEFHVWALEDVSTTLNNLLKKRCYKMDTIVCEEEDDAKDVIHNAKSGVVSALSLLISSFEDELKSRTVQMGHGSSTMAIPTTNTNTSSSAEKYKSHATYKLRAIYALGSLLRGNPNAQQVFIQQYNGSDVLVRNVLGTLSSVRGSSVGDKTCIKLDYKFASKVLALGQDVVMDVMLHEDDYHPTSTNNEGKEEEEEEVTILQIVGAFTTEEWCDLSLRMLLPPTDVIGEVSSRGMKERALHAIRALAPGCSTLQYNDGEDDDGTTINFINKSWGIEEVKRVRSEWNREGSDDGLDTVYRRELLTLVDDVLEVLNQQRMQNDMTEWGKLLIERRASKVMAPY